MIEAFGAEPLPLQLMVASLGVIALWASYHLVRGFLPRTQAVLAVSQMSQQHGGFSAWRGSQKR